MIFSIGRCYDSQKTGSAPAASLSASSFTEEDALEKSDYMGLTDPKKNKQIQIDIVGE